MFDTFHAAVQRVYARQVLKHNLVNTQVRPSPVQHAAACSRAHACDSRPVQRAKLMEYQDYNAAHKGVKAMIRRGDRQMGAHRDPQDRTTEVSMQTLPMLGSRPWQEAAWWATGLRQHGRSPGRRWQQMAN